VEDGENIVGGNEKYGPGDATGEIGADELGAAEKLGENLTPEIKDDHIEKNMKKVLLDKHVSQQGPGTVQQGGEIGRNSQPVSDTGSPFDIRRPCGQSIQPINQMSEINEDENGYIDQY